MIDYYLDYCPRPYYLKEVLFTCLFGGFLTVSCHSERNEESDNVCFIFSADVYRFFTSFRMTETVGILTLPLHHQISIIKKSYLIQPKNEVILTFVV